MICAVHKMAVQSSIGDVRNAVALLSELCSNKR